MTKTQKNVAYVGSAVFFIATAPWWVRLQAECRVDQALGSVMAMAFVAMMLYFTLKFIFGVTLGVAIGLKDVERQWKRSWLGRQFPLQGHKLAGLSFAGICLLAGLGAFAICLWLRDAQRTDMGELGAFCIPGLIAVITSDVGIMMVRRLWRRPQPEPQPQTD